MAARTEVKSILGATLGISATRPATFDAAGYAATGVVFTAISEVENWGNHGITSNIGTFTPIDTGIVSKRKGSKDYGTMSLAIGSIPSDAGQVIVEAASESSNRYSVKLTYPDGEIHYMDVLVAKKEYQDGSVDDAMKIAVDLAICKKPVVVAAV